MCVTPDGDVYSEDVAELEFVPSRFGRVPRAMGGAMLYRFSPLEELYDGVGWQEIFDEGIATAQLERAAEGHEGAAMDAAAMHIRQQIGAVGILAVANGEVGPAPGGVGAGGAVVAHPAPAAPAAAVGVVAQAAPAGGGGGVPAAVGAAELPLVGGGAGRLVAAPPAAVVMAQPEADAVWVVNEDCPHPAAPPRGAVMALTADAVVVGACAINTLADGSPITLRRRPRGDDGLRAGAQERGGVRPCLPAPAAQGLAGYIAGQSGGAALGPPRGEGGVASLDARVCAVQYDERGERFRQFSESVNLMEEPPWPDWPISGPRTVRWLCKYIKDGGLTPKSRTGRFLADAHVPETDRVRHEHGTLMEVLEMAVVYDQVDVSALASFELLSRRVRLLEEAYTANPKNPRFEGSEYFVGLGRRSCAVSPALTAHVASALQADAQIQKERRKAREEAALAAKPPK